MNSQEKRCTRRKKSNSDDALINIPDDPKLNTHCDQRQSSKRYLQEKTDKPSKRHRRKSSSKEYGLQKNPVVTTENKNSVLTTENVCTKYRDKGDSKKEKTSHRACDEYLKEMMASARYKSHDCVGTSSKHVSENPNGKSPSRKHSQTPFLELKPTVDNTKRQSNSTLSQTPLLEPKPTMGNTNCKSSSTLAQNDSNPKKGYLPEGGHRTTYKQPLTNYSYSNPLFKHLASRSADYHTYDRHDARSRYVNPPERKLHHGHSHSGNSTGHSKHELTHALPSNPDLPRSWEFTEFGKRHIQKPYPGMELTVMSYNVLSQDLLEDNFYLYSRCQREFLEWNYRKDRILEEIRQFHPDVMCFQEVNDGHYFDFFLPELTKLGYNGKYQKRVGDKKDGCATFFNTDKLELEHSFPVNYNLGGIMDRDNIALILTIRFKECHSKIFIANTHLLFNPRRGDIKFGQLMVLFAELDRLALKSCSHGYIYHPIILCGDFNCTPLSEIFRFIAGGYSHYEGLKSKHLSGQKKSWSGSDTVMHRDFFPARFGISDQCQYSSLSKKRLLGNICYPEPSPCVNDRSEKQKQLPQSASSSAVTTYAGGSTPPPLSGCSPTYDQQNIPYISHGSGHLWHNLNFVASHNFTIQRLGNNSKEITTFHDSAVHDGCIVDHIFYNVKRKEVRTVGNELQTRRVEESQLGLIGRYGLMSAKELNKFGCMPNRKFPSDHLFLLVKFLLKK